MSSGGAVAAAVAIPVVVGGGGVAAYFLLSDGKPKGQAVATGTGAQPYYDPFVQAVDALGTAIVTEGGRVVKAVAKEAKGVAVEVGHFVADVNQPIVDAYRGTKQVYSDLRGGVQTVYGDVRSGIGSAYNGTKAVIKAAPGGAIAPVRTIANAVSGAFSGKLTKEQARKRGPSGFGF